MRLKPARAVAVLCLVGGSTLAGCGSNPFGRDADLRANLSPEVDTLYQRPVDVENALAITGDTNWRMFNQDLGRAFYTDRPSRLTREPIPR